MFDQWIGMYTTHMGITVDKSRVYNPHEYRYKYDNRYRIILQSRRPRSAGRAVTSRTRLSTGRCSSSLALASTCLQEAKTCSAYSYRTQSWCPCDVSVSSTRPLSKSSLARLSSVLEPATSSRYVMRMCTCMFVQTAHNMPLSRHLDRSARVFQNESSDSIGGNV